MNTSLRTLIYFSISFMTLLLPPSFLPMRLLSFSPFLADLTVRSEKSPPYFFAVFCGLLLDLFSYETRFGFFSLIALMTTFLFFFLRRFLFSDRLLSLPIHTALFSSIFTLLSLLLWRLFHPPLPFTLSSLLHEISLPPLADALYALICFTLPTFLWHKMRKTPWMLRFRMWRRR